MSQVSSLLWLHAVQCEQAMQDAVTAETCWAWLAAASVHHFDGLEEHCRDFICRNFSNLIQMHHFLEADADQLVKVNILFLLSV